MMHDTRSIAVLLLLGLGLGCGPTATATDDAAGPGPADARPPADAAPPDAPPAVACTIVLSGAVQGSFPCQTTALKRDADDFTIIGAIATPTAEVSNLLFSGRIAGEPQVKDYAAGDFLSIDATVQTAGNLYSASGTQTGNITGLHLTSLVPQPSPGGGKIWTPHGSFIATLISTQGPGNVTMMATF